MGGQGATAICLWNFLSYSSLYCALTNMFHCRLCCLDVSVLQQPVLPLDVSVLYHPVLPLYLPVLKQPVLPLIYLFCRSLFCPWQFCSSEYCAIPLDKSVLQQCVLFLDVFVCLFTSSVYYPRRCLAYSSLCCTCRCVCLSFELLCCTLTCLSSRALLHLSICLIWSVYWSYCASLGFVCMSTIACVVPVHVLHFTWTYLSTKACAAPARVFLQELPLDMSVYKSLCCTCTCAFCAVPGRFCLQEPVLLNRVKI